MSYVIIGLVVIILILLGVKIPSKSVQKLLSDREKFTKGIYENLPPEVKKSIPPEILETSIEVIIDIAIDTIEEKFK